MSARDDDFTQVLTRLQSVRDELRTTTSPERVAMVAVRPVSRPVSFSSQTAPTVAWTHISISCSGTQNRNRKSAGEPAGGDSTKPLS